MATTQRKSSVRAGINVTIFFLLFISPILGYYVSQKKIRQFFVPERKYAANLAVQMFATGARFRYGTPGLTTESTHNSVLELDGELLSRRGNYSWLDEQSEDFAKAVYLVHFAGFVHNEFLKVNQFSRLEPAAQLQDWATMILQEGGKGLEDVLIELNSAILGQEGKTNLFAAFQENCILNETDDLCAVTSEFRDYLVALQIQGYALLLAALNCIGNRRAAIMAQMMAINRLVQQEEVLGARYNDWYNHGLASCSFQVMKASSPHKLCIKLRGETIADGTPALLEFCDPRDPTAFDQWKYNEASKQLTLKANSSYCLQRRLHDFKNGNPVIIRMCSNQQTMFYGEKWEFSPSTGQIIHVASPDKCLTSRGLGKEIVLWDCSSPKQSSNSSTTAIHHHLEKYGGGESGNACPECNDKWGDDDLNLQTKLKSVFKTPLGELGLVRWVGVDA